MTVSATRNRARTFLNLLPAASAICLTPIVDTPFLLLLLVYFLLSWIRFCTVVAPFSTKSGFDFPLRGQFFNDSGSFVPCLFVLFFLRLSCVVVLLFFCFFVCLFVSLFVSFLVRLGSFCRLWIEMNLASRTSLSY